MRQIVALPAFWFFYFGGLGIFFPYFGLYLRENIGLSGGQVGTVLAVIPLAGIFAQPLWGQVADLTGRRSTLLSILALCAALGYGAIAAAPGFPGILLATATMAIFSTAVVPLAVSVTLAAPLNRGPHAFGLVRVWGTLGYLLCVVGFPWILHQVQGRAGLQRAVDGPSEPGLQLMFIVTAGMAMAAAAVGPALPRGGSVSLRAGRGDWRLLLRDVAFIRVLAFMLLAFLFLQGPMGLFPIYVRAHGGDLDTVGRMWIIMLLVEIPLVLYAGAGLERLGARGLLAVGVIAGGLRWVLCSVAVDLRIIYAAQALHGIVVTGLLLGAPLYVECIVPERQRSTAQGLLAMVGVGCGGMLSNLIAGELLERFGPNAPYLWGGLGALVLGLCARRLLPAPVWRADPSRVGPAGKPYP